MSKHRLVDYEVGTTFFDFLGRLMVVNSTEHFEWTAIEFTGRSISVGDEWERDE